VIRPETGLWPIRIGEVMPRGRRQGQIPGRTSHVTITATWGFRQLGREGLGRSALWDEGVWWFVAPPRAGLQRSGSRDPTRT